MEILFLKCIELLLSWQKKKSKSSAFKKKKKHVQLLHKRSKGADTSTASKKKKRERNDCGCRTSRSQRLRKIHRLTLGTVNSSQFLNLPLTFFPPPEVGLRERKMPIIKIHLSQQSS